MGRSGHRTSWLRVVGGAAASLCLAGTYVWAGGAQFGPSDPPSAIDGNRPVPAGGEVETFDRILRDDEFLAARAFPFDDVPVDGRRSAQEQAVAMPVIEAVRSLPESDTVIGQPLTPADFANQSANLLLPVDWTPVSTAGTTSLGPDTDGGLWNGSVPLAGRVVAIANHPTDADIAYIGAASGGVWKTTDGGANWSPVFDDQSTLSIGSIAIDPGTPKTVYVGTGEGSGGQYYGDGVFKSIDGGATWTKLGGTWFDNCHIGDILVLPGTNTVVVAVSKQATNTWRPFRPAGGCTSNGTFSSTGIWRSIDGGANWVFATSSAGVSDLAVDPNDPTHIYAGDYQYGVTFSGSSGAVGSWTFNSSANAIANRGRVELTVADNGATSTVYAAMSNLAASNTLLGVYSSANTFNAPFGLLSAPGGICNYPGSSGGQCGYDFAIAANPGAPAEIFLAGIWLGRSTNGGTTWGYAGSTPTNGIYGNSPNPVHVDHQNLSFDANNRLWVVTDGGVYRKDGTTYTNLNGTLNLHQFQTGISAGATGKFWAGTQDLGSARYVGGPGWTMFSNGDGGPTAVDPTNENVVYSSYVNLSTSKSTNGGVTSEYLAGSGDCLGLGSSQCLFYAPMEIDTSRPERVYVGTRRVNRTTDGWATPPAAFSPNFAGLITSIAPSASDASTVYAATTTGEVRVTTDGGAVWNLRTTGLPTRWVTDLLVDPANASNAWVTLSGFDASHVWATTDAGVTWTDVSTGLPNTPVNAIDADFRVIPPILYIGTDIGVFASENNGTTWARYGNNLPNVTVLDVVVNSATSKLVAGTSGRGMFVASLGGNPLAPLGVSATGANASAAVSWSAPASDGGHTITEYTATASPGGSTCVTTGTLMCVVGGLSNGTPYTFTVTAKNVTGTGPSSAPSAPVTPATVPGAPLSPSASPGALTIAVSWLAPASNGGASITEYTATASPGGATCATTGALTCTISGLSNGTAYTVTVTAKNVAGTGAPSAPSAPVTPSMVPGAPRSPSATAGAERIAVSWLSPSSDGGASITGYTATASPGGATCASTGALTCAIPGLTNGTAYSVTVTATNVAGTGAASTAATAIPGAVWVGVTPARLLDTRPTGVTVDDVGARGGQVAAGSTTRVKVTGRAGVSPGAGSSIVNVTAIRPVGVGYFTVFPCSETPPNASSLNFSAGDNLGNEIVAQLNDAGEFCIFSSVASHIAVDVVGYLPAGTAYGPVTPARLLDTRPVGETVDGQAQKIGRVSGGEQIKLLVADRAIIGNIDSLPDSVETVIVNVTAIRPDSVGFIAVHPCLSPLPDSSSLNYTTGISRGNEIVAPLSNDGSICLFSSASTDLAVDIVGFLPGGASLSGVTPARLLDTRVNGKTLDGVSQGGGPPAAGTLTRVRVTGRADVPAGARTAMLNITAVNPTGTGFATVWPCGEQPLASSLNFRAGVNGGNDLIAGLSAEGDICILNSTSTNLTVDVTGYTTV